MLAIRVFKRLLGRKILLSKKEDIIRNMISSFVIMSENKDSTRMRQFIDCLPSLRIIADYIKLATDIKGVDN